MAISGADVAQLRDLAGAFDSAATRMDAGRAAVSNKIQLRLWVGPIALRFRLNWDSQYSRMIHAAADELRQAAKILRDNADEQARASAAPGGLLSSLVPTISIPEPLPDQTPAEVNAQRLRNWAAGAIGRGIDYDHAFGNQCVDVIKDYASTVFPGTPASTSIGFGNANQVYAHASSEYFDKIPPGSSPQPGDIVCIDTNPYSSYGHVAVIEKIENGVITVIQQDGSHPSGTTFEGHLSQTEWSHLQGYLRPKN